MKKQTMVGILLALSVSASCGGDDVPTAPSSIDHPGLHRDTGSATPGTWNAAQSSSADSQETSELNRRTPGARSNTTETTGAQAVTGVTWEVFGSKQVYLTWDQLPSTVIETWSVTRYEVRNGTAVEGSVVTTRCTDGTCTWTGDVLENGRYTYSITADGTRPGESASVTVTVTDTIPDAPRNIVGVQERGTTTAIISWDPPFGPGTGIEETPVTLTVDSSINYYTATRDYHAVKEIRASACSSTASPACSISFDGLGTEDHFFSVVSVNAAGRSENAHVTVHINDPAPFTVTTLTAPSVHTADAFEFTIAFSERFSISYRDLQNGAFTVTNGRITNVRRIDRGSNRKWGIRITPSSASADVTAVLPNNIACTETRAVCNDYDEQLESALTVTVPGTSPFTATATDVPSSHNHPTKFAFTLTFSENANISYRTLRDSAFDVTNGSITRARRQQRGNNERWTIEVEPASLTANVTVTLPNNIACSETRAICSDNDQNLQDAVTVTVLAP